MNRALALASASPLGLVALGCAATTDLVSRLPQATLVPVTVASQTVSVPLRFEAIPTAPAAPLAEVEQAGEHAAVQQLPRVHVVASAVPRGPAIAAESKSERSIPLHPFGESLPVLTCTVLRTCVIELESGETLVDDPIAGDQARWIITTAKAGKSGASTLVVVKPKACDVSTNLVLSTDRRIYDVDLDSPTCSPRETNPKRAYTRRIKFTYPNDAVAADSDLASTRHAAPAGNTARDTTNLTEFIQPSPPYNGDYRIVGSPRGPFGMLGRRGSEFPWRPTRIADDGRHVYIWLPESAGRYPSPVVYALEDDDSRTMVNYSVRDTVMVTDRVFRRGILVVPEGNRERALVFENRAWSVVPANEKR